MRSPPEVAEHLAQICRTRLHASAAQSLDDWRRASTGIPACAAGLCARSWRHGRRLSAQLAVQWIALSRLDCARDFPGASARQWEIRWFDASCARCCGNAGRFRRADFPPDQHQHRNLARTRKRHLAFIRRSPDGVPHGAAQGLRWVPSCCPSLARANARRSGDEYSGLLDWGLRLVLLLGLPAPLTMVMLSDALVQRYFTMVVFRHGRG